ncbi:cyclic nucleotide-binding domain protein (macronuclear) [Tetrahymena thermophila SB210]|uniref:Cyclic nucleotide-binding domain protein n=1 Tax=Tetrahymena thermophila (strain SB210) TaxID=312017 RepID=Q22UD1_TETTS|nr:cyclic nucleotide-binding domain protein [Tetrahymena thermophila SB210]EAR88756.1 cyclic nucleotide-binding domain protein [Tetrahymena thermophila SB210]|eukprot:XP_001009001.1 cyclic nucleotide-binding domain protein [Tetrahymena thermophila SB210]
MNKLVAKLSQLKASQSEYPDLETNAEQIQRKQLPFVSIIGAQKINLEKETSNFLQRGSLDSAGLLRALESKDQGQNLSEKEKALYQIFNKKEIDLRNSAEANLAIYILRKQIKNNLEMRFLQQVIQNISIFKQNPGMASDSLISSNLFKQLKHEFYPRRTVLFNYGDQGDKYYIVLKGSVYCLLPDSQLSEEQRSCNRSLNLQQNRPHSPQSNRSSNQQEQLEKEDNPKFLKVLQNITAKKKTFAFFAKLGMAQTFLEEIREEQALTDEEYMRKKFPDFKAVKQIGPGESFGEIALMTNKGRTATIFLKEDTHFMSLSKEGFNKVFSIYKAKILEDQIQFLHNFSFFRDLSKFSLLQLLYHFRIEVFSCKQIIYSQKDSADKLYLVHRGEVEISKKYIIKEDQTEPQYFKNNLINRNSNFKMTKDENKYIIEKSTDGAINLKQSLKRQNQIQKNITISKVGSNSYFGEYEIINEKSLRETQAKCSSVTSEIYIIDIKKLKQILSVKEYQMLIEESKVRIEFQEKRIHQSINLKENQMEVLKQNNSMNNNKSVNEFQNQHSIKAINQKRNSLYEKQQQNQENYELPQPSQLIKGGVILCKDQTSYNLTSRTEESVIIPQTPKTIFPSSKVTRKSFASSNKDSTMTSSATTRLQSQSKHRSSLQNIQDDFNSLTQILNQEVTPFKTSLNQLSSAQIPFTNNKIKRTLTLQQTNGYIPGLYPQKTLANLPIASMKQYFKSQKSERYINQETELKTESCGGYEQGNDDIQDQIQKLKEVYQLSVKRGAMLKEYSKRLMVQQLVEKPKQNLASQILRSKRKIQGNNHLSAEQKSIINSSTQIPSSMQSQTKKDITSLKTLHHTESTPNITSLMYIRDSLNVRSPLNKNNSIIIQQNEVRVPAFNE